METKVVDGIQRPTSKFATQYYLLLISSAYIVAAANEYLIVNWLKDFGVKLPLYFAILQNSSWPVQLYIYLNECKTLPEKRVISPAMYRSYGILGCLAAFINISRMFALSNLPPVLTVICSNTEIVFETIMTVFVLKKSVSNYQYAAVSLVIVGVFVALYDPSSGTFGTSNNSDSHGNSVTASTYALAVALSILSRFASSLNTILAEKFLGKGAKSKIGVKECTLANSIIPFCILPFGLLITREYTLWPAQLMHYPSAHATTAAVFFLSLGLCEAKHVDRFSKYAIVEHTSTIFFAGVDSAMKMIAGILSFAFFPSQGGTLQWPYMVGFFLIACAIVLLYVDKRKSAHVVNNAGVMVMELPAYNPMVDLELCDSPQSDTSSEASTVRTALETTRYSAENAFTEYIYDVDGPVRQEEESVRNPLQHDNNSIVQVHATSPAAMSACGTSKERLLVVQKESLHMYTSIPQPTDAFDFL